MKEKYGHCLQFLQILKLFQCQKLMESKTQKILIRTNFKNMLRAVVAINQYVLMIILVSLLRYTQAKDAVYNVINSMIKESKYYSDAIKKINREFVMAKEDYENFEKSSKSWVYDNDYIDNDFKVRDHCHITGKHRGSAYRDRKFLVVFCNVKNMIFILLCKNQVNSMFQVYILYLMDQKFI